MGNFIRIIYDTEAKKDISQHKHSCITLLWSSRRYLSTQVIAKTELTKSLFHTEGLANC